MKVRTSFVALAAAALSAVACASNPPPQEPTTTGATTTEPPPAENTPPPQQNEGMQNGQNQNVTPERQGAPGTTGATGTPATPQQANQYMFTSDGQIAGFMAAVNKAEVKQAHLALQRAKDPQVKAFAQHMIAKHGQMERSQQHTMSSMRMTPEATPASNQLESDAQSSLASLESKTGSDFDKAYIDLQVKEHQQVLGMLGSSIIPAAHDTEYKRQLMNAKPELEDHLRRAEALQQKLTAP